MQVRPPSTHRTTSPCLASARRSSPPRRRGLAKLEFALTVAVLAVIAALALEHIAALQVSARSAEQETAAAQARSVAALAEAHGAIATAASAAAARPCQITPARAASTGTLPPAKPPLSCP